jgi:hypothetical protein
MATYRTGEKAPESGIYQCTSFFCSQMKTVPRGKKLPPCRNGHHEWTLVSQTTKSKNRRGKGFFG